MSKELYKRYRPKFLRDVVGQDSAISTLQKYADKESFPHSILFTGPSGCGKTTLARILKRLLHCGNADFNELNCADFRSIDDIRQIRSRTGYSAISGSCRIWLIDECHKLTNDAQTAFLKLLEDTPDHVYFLLATTDPNKVIKTIRTRCTEIKLLPLTQPGLCQMMKTIAEKEGLALSDEMLGEIAEASEGSARKALVILDQVASLDDEDQQRKAITAHSVNKQTAIELARALLFGRGGWGPVAKILRDLSDEEPEGIRYLVLSYARSCLIGKDEKPPNMKVASLAFKVIDIFSDNFYDSKHAGLAAACWEVVNT
jgi:DNA polymerase III gamma/tau subunit